MSDKGRRGNKDFICRTESTLAFIGNAVFVLNIRGNTGSKLSHRHYVLYVLWHKQFLVIGQTPFVPDNRKKSKCHRLLPITVSCDYSLQGEIFLKRKLAGITTVSKIQRETQVLGKRL